MGVGMREGRHQCCGEGLISGHMWECYFLSMQMSGTLLWVVLYCPRVRHFKLFHKPKWVGCSSLDLRNAKHSFTFSLTYLGPAFPWEGNGWTPPNVWLGLKHVDPKFPREGDSGLCRMLI